MNFLDPRPHLGPDGLGLVRVFGLLGEICLLFLIDFALARDQVDLLNGNNSGAVVDLVSTPESSEGWLNKLNIRDAISSADENVLGRAM